MSAYLSLPIPIFLWRAGHKRPSGVHVLAYSPMVEKPGALRKGDTRNNRHQSPVAERTVWEQLETEAQRRKPFRERGTPHKVMAQI